MMKPIPNFIDKRLVACAVELEQYYHRAWAVGISHDRAKRILDCELKKHGLFEAIGRASRILARGELK